MVSVCFPCTFPRSQFRFLCPGCPFPFPSRLLDLASIVFLFFVNFALWGDLSRDGRNFFSPTSIFILNVLRDLKVSSILEISHPVQSHFGKYEHVGASLVIIPVWFIFRFRVPIGRNSGGIEMRFLVVFENSSVVFLFFFFRATKFPPFQYQISHFAKCSGPDFSHPVPSTRLRL